MFVMNLWLLDVHHWQPAALGLHLAPPFAINATTTIFCISSKSLILLVICLLHYPLLDLLRFQWQFVLVCCCCTRLSVAWACNTFFFLLKVCITLEWFYEYCCRVVVMMYRHHDVNRIFSIGNNFWLSTAHQESFFAGHLPAPSNKNLSSSYLPQMLSLLVICVKTFILYIFCIRPQRNTAHFVGKATEVYMACI